MFIREKSLVISARKAIIKSDLKLVSVAIGVILGHYPKFQTN